MFKVRLFWPQNFVKCTKSLRMCEEVRKIRCQIASNGKGDDLSYLDKIVFLQKCVLKMEKLYKKSEKKHARTIAKLKQEIELTRKSEQVCFRDVFVVGLRMILLTYTVTFHTFMLQIIVFKTFCIQVQFK